MADYPARLLTEDRFIPHQQILSTRPARRSVDAERPGVPKPDARGHDARSVKREPGGRLYRCYHDPGAAVWRPRPGRGRVGRGEEEPDMVATHGRDDFAEMPQRDDRSKGTPHSVNPRALGAPVTALLESR